MDVARNVSVSMFETTIRIVGGLLAAYDLADDPLLLSRARALADKVLVNFRVTGAGTPLGLRVEQGLDRITMTDKALVDFCATGRGKLLGQGSG